ncbi:MAG: hypothetical protein ING19_00500 [Azospirillum sp.]|nr:hypothetical protein [Azospirillum sp.]
MRALVDIASRIGEDSTRQLKPFTRWKALDLALLEVELFWPLFEKETECAYGWLARNGRFVGTKFGGHERFLSMLGLTAGDVEKAGWIRIVEGRLFSEIPKEAIARRRPSWNQRACLKKMSIGDGVYGFLEVETEKTDAILRLEMMPETAVLLGPGAFETAPKHVPKTVLDADKEPKTTKAEDIEEIETDLEARAGMSRG